VGGGVLKKKKNLGRERMGRFIKRKDEGKAENITNERRRVKK